MCAHTSWVAVAEAVVWIAAFGLLETSSNHVEQLLRIVPCNNQEAFADPIRGRHPHCKEYSGIFMNNVI